MIILGLGTNIGNRLQNLRTALQKITEVPGITVINVSPIYESDALLPDNASDASWNQPYLNLAVSCKTTLQPNELYKHTKQIEHSMGRPENYPHWSPRLMDIDLLAWGEQLIQNDVLHVPHQNLTDRPFALWPLADLAPNWIFRVPNHRYFGKTAAEIIKQFGSRFDGLAPLHTKQIRHRIDFPQLVGILNVTPDSFSDGGKFNSLEQAINHAQHLFQSGAEILDIGAESTRPDITQILSEEDEWQRLEPVLKEVGRLWHNQANRPLISIDTRHYRVAEKAITLGIDWINDVTGFNDPNMLDVVKHAPVKLLFMHSLSCPPREDLVWQANTDPIAELVTWTNKKLSLFDHVGIKPERLIFDPGIGFGKTSEQNFAIIKRTQELQQQIPLPLLIGHSRKSFLKQFTDQPANSRDLESIMISNYLALQKVSYLRVHDVASHLRSFKISAALKQG